MKTVKGEWMKPKKTWLDFNLAISAGFFTFQGELVLDRYGIHLKKTLQMKFRFFR